MPPSGLQDLADVLSDVLKAVAGTPLEFQISVTLGGGETVPPETVDAIDELRTGVSEELRLKARPSQRVPTACSSPVQCSDPPASE